jgi:hypothetical protein
VGRWAGRQQPDMYQAGPCCVQQGKTTFLQQAANYDNQQPPLKLPMHRADVHKC